MERKEQTAPALAALRASMADSVIAIDLVSPLTTLCSAQLYAYDSIACV